MINLLRATSSAVAKLMPAVFAGILLVAACGGGSDLSAEEQAIAEDWADELIRDFAADQQELPRDEGVCATEKMVAEFGAEKAADYLAEDEAVLGENDFVYPEADARVIAAAAAECIDWESMLTATFEAEGLPSEQAACVAEAFAENVEELSYRGLAGLDTEDLLDLNQVAADCGVEF